MKKIKNVLLTMLVLAALIVLPACNTTGKKGENPVKNRSDFVTNEITFANAPTIVKSEKTLYMKDLHYETIKLPEECASTAWIVASGNSVFFSGGSDKPSSAYPPCLTYIEYLFEYNTETKKITTIAKIDKGFVQIDWVGADKKWIVYREVAIEYGGPVRIYAINRENHLKKLVFESKSSKTPENTFNPNIYQNYLILPQSVFKATKRDKNGEIEDGLFTNSIKIIDLSSGASKVIFSKVSPLKLGGAIFSTTVNSSYLAFNYAEGGEQTIYLYDFNKGMLKKLLSVPLKSDPFGSKNYLTSVVQLTEDNNIIFECPETKQNAVFGTVIAPIENIKHMQLLFKNIPDYYITWPQHEPGNYIALDNRKESFMVINRNSGTLTKIRDLGGSFDFIGDSKIISEHSFLAESKGRDIRTEVMILLDLKRNGL